MAVMLGSGLPFDQKVKRYNSAQIGHSLQSTPYSVYLTGDFIIGLLGQHGLIGSAGSGIRGRLPVQQTN